MPDTRTARPTPAQVERAASLLKMPVETIQRAVDDYFAEPKTFGRPRREIDPVQAQAALKGRSMREAAALLKIPASTLRDHLKRY